MTVEELTERAEDEMVRFGRIFTDTVMQLAQHGVDIATLNLFRNPEEE